MDSSSVRWFVSQLEHILGDLVEPIKQICDRWDMPPIDAGKARAFAEAMGDLRKQCDQLIEAFYHQHAKTRSKWYGDTNSQAYRFLGPPLMPDQIEQSSPYASHQIYANLRKLRSMLAYHETAHEALARKGSNSQPHFDTVVACGIAIGLGLADVVGTSWIPGVDIITDSAGVVDITASTGTGVAEATTMTAIETTGVEATDLAATAAPEVIPEVAPEALPEVAPEAPPEVPPPDMPPIPITTILTGGAIITALVLGIKFLVSELDKGKGNIPTPQPLPDPYPIDQRTKTKEKERDCKKVEAEGDAFYGPGLVQEYKTVHPNTWCFILGEIEDMDELTARGFGGIYTLESYLRQGNGSNFARGAFFELQWLHDHLDSVQSIEPNDPSGNQGVDAIDTAGNYIDFKSVDSSNMSSLTDDWKRQILNDLEKYSGQIPPHKLRIIFDGSKLRTGQLPPSVLTMFQEIEAEAPPNQKNSVEFIIWTPEKQMTAAS